MQATKVNYITKIDYAVICRCVEQIWVPKMLMQMQGRKQLQNDV